MRSMLRWAALMGVGLLITGCAAQPLAPQVEEVVITQTPGSAESPAPQAGPITLYYPEGASQGDAAYALTYDLPVFSGTEPAVSAMNAAIQGWREELLDRVESERLPLADRAEGADLPGTQVTSLCVWATLPACCSMNPIGMKMKMALPSGSRPWCLTRRAWNAI